MGDIAESISLLGNEDMSSINVMAAGIQTLFYEYVYLILKSDKPTL